MASRDSTPTGFRQRFMSGETLVGTFVKTPATHPIEILGSLGFEFVVIDEEHAPWDRMAIDAALLAARASGTAGIVRVAEPTPAKILAVLDDGATGVLVPHVSSAAKAQEIVKACRYRGGRRGFSNTTRAGDFGAVGVWPHVDAQDAAVTFIAMIEDPEALDEIDAIVGTEGLDGVFIGRGDLTVALGAPAMDAPEIMSACETIIAAAKKVNKPVAMMVANADDANRFHAMGATTFIVASDQGFLRLAASKAYADISAVGAKSA
ncbi:HpcH/HpaI aldolase family protein [Tianweitania sediminis]|uniref:Aldolase n=1 Tax=Tianweitania sediminis TaxID=1502156 RepID=A0A8J7QVI2_9HYPH|nr:aldolase/citrate lyase family protein [Tianweitania sediminis]MBP0437183.1 aldolase [Tianweitania sediminis]